MSNIALDFIAANPAKLAALFSITIGVLIAAYLLAIRADFSEIDVALITMFVGTPIGLLFNSTDNKV